MKKLISKIEKLNETQINLLAFAIVATAIVSFFVFASDVDMSLNNWYNFKK